MTLPQRTALVACLPAMCVFLRLFHRGEEKTCHPPFLAAWMLAMYDRT